MNFIPLKTILVKESPIFVLRILLANVRPVLHSIRWQTTPPGGPSQVTIPKFAYSRLKIVQDTLMAFVMVVIRISIECLLVPTLSRPVTNTRLIVPPRRAKSVRLVLIIIISVPIKNRVNR